VKIEFDWFGFWDFLILSPTIVLGLEIFDTLTPAVVLRETQLPKLSTDKWEAELFEFSKFVFEGSPFLGKGVDCDEMCLRRKLLSVTFSFIES